MALIDTTLTSDGSTSTITWDAGRGLVAVFGTFGSGTLDLEVSFDNGTTWMTVQSDLSPTGQTNLSFTSNGARTFVLPSGIDVRATLSGATTPDLNVKVYEYTPVILKK